MVFPGVNTDADVCFAVVVNVVALVDQDQDQLADLSALVITVLLPGGTCRVSGAAQPRDLLGSCGGRCLPGPGVRMHHGQGHDGPGVIGFGVPAQLSSKPTKKFIHIIQDPLTTLVTGAFTKTPVLSGEREGVVRWRLHIDIKCWKS